MLTLQNRSYLLYKIHDINLANWSDGFCKLIGLINNPPLRLIQGSHLPPGPEDMNGFHFATCLMLRVMIIMVGIYHGHHNHDPHPDHPHNHHHYHHGSYFATRLLLPPPLSPQCSNLHWTAPNGMDDKPMFFGTTPLDGNRLSDSWQPECIQTAFKHSVIDHQLISCALIVYLIVWSLQQGLSNSYTRKASPKVFLLSLDKL